MRRLGFLLVALCALLVANTATSLAVTLPSQASQVAEEHTHGPDGLDLDRRGRPPGAAVTYDVDAVATWAAGGYDGKVTQVDETDLTNLPKFHAIYIHPKDKASRFRTFAPMFQADARDASSLLTTLYSRAIRFDERPATDRDGTMLDITVVRSQYSSRQLATTNQFNLVADELAAKFNDPDKKYMVWLDAGSQYCGQANLSHDINRNAANPNEARTLAIVYRPYATNDATTGGFCRGRTLRHELGHSMGALQIKAPNTIDGAHCGDSGEDTMCYTSATTPETGPPAFDYNNDDYWDPAANPPLASTAKLPWWTVNNSRFICPVAGCATPSTPDY